MKSFVLLAAIILALAPGLAWSENAPPAAGKGGPPPQMMMGDAKNFAQHKEMMLKHMNEHLADVQKRISCVQAANNHEDLRGCMIHFGGPPGGPMPGGMMHGQQPMSHAAPQGDHK